MITRYFKIDHHNPEEEVLAQLSAFIAQGELVAFPTETVYGLGACAFQIDAVHRIFEVKGRPPENPLLVHVSSLRQVEELVAAFPEDARILMETFWPGPLSIILPAAQNVPDIVRGGKAGVGVRMPAHPAALALIARTGPLAAPSANLHGRPSPTSAEHVRDDLDGKIAAVLDAGETGIGMESTLIDMTGPEYKILRRGGLEPESIQKTLRRDIEIVCSQKAGYQTSLKILLAQNHAQYLQWITSSLQEGHKIVLVDYIYQEPFSTGNVLKQYYINLNDRNIKLYAMIREAEDLGATLILFAPLPPGLTGIALSLADRIVRASHPQND